MENLKNFDDFKSDKSINEAFNPKNAKKALLKNIYSTRKVVQDYSKELGASLDEFEKELLKKNKEAYDITNGSFDLKMSNEQLTSRLESLKKDIKDIQSFLTAGSGSFENYFDDDSETLDNLLGIEDDEDED